MLAVEKWAQGKQPLIASFAVQLVTFSDIVYEVLPQARDRRLFNHQFPLPDLPTWYRLYRSPLKPLIAFVNLIGEFSETGVKLKELACGVVKLFRLLNRNQDYFEENPPPPDKVKYWIDHVSKIFALISADIRDEFDPQPLDPEERARFFKFMLDHEQELAFVFFLYIPCLLIYQTSPRSLYRKAIKGDVDSMENLLKLDPLMLNNPVLGQQIQALRFSNRTNDYERVNAAVHKFAGTNYSDVQEGRKRSKVMMASIISSLSKKAGFPLDHLQIAKLFDAYSRDRKKGDIDSDLPVEESFRKAIKRHSPPWLNLLQNMDNKK